MSSRSLLLNGLFSAAIYEGDSLAWVDTPVSKLRFQESENGVAIIIFLHRAHLFDTLKPIFVRRNFDRTIYCTLKARNCNCDEVSK